MPGPAPKPEGEKRRRNQATFDWTLLPRSGRKGATPKLPTRTPAGRAWSASTKSWWAKLWHTPQSTQWGEHDDALLRMAWLREKFWANDASAAEMSELRQLEDRYGLNDKAMLQLRWRIVDDELLEHGTAAPDAPKAGGERRERLRVVAGGAS